MGLCSLCIDSRVHRSMHSTIYALSDTDTSLATASAGEKGGPTQGALTDMQNLFQKRKINWVINLY